MYFCNICSYSLDIIKDDTLEDISEITKLFEIIKNTNNITDIKSLHKYNIIIPIEKIKSNQQYKKLTPDEKKLIEKLKFNESNNVSFYCKNCTDKVAITKTTLLYVIQYENINNEDIIYDDVELLIKDPLLAHTNNYVCINKKCDTHDNVNKKDAVMTKSRNKYNVEYICTCCKSIWKS